MTDKPRRKLRLRRRKRNGGDDALDAVAGFGCCLVEAVFVTTSAVAFLLVPIVLLS